MTKKSLSEAIYDRYCTGYVHVSFTIHSLTMRGRWRLRKQGFQKNTPDPRRARVRPYPYISTSRESIVRTTDADFDVVQQQCSKTGQPIISLTETGQKVDYTVLRPVKTRTFIQEYKDRSEDHDHNASYHTGKLIEFITKIVNDHSRGSPECVADLTWCEENSEKRGLAWAESVRCKNCGYASEKTKLYDEVCTGKQGRRAAKPNIGVQVALARQGISASGFVDILSAANIPPPSTSGLQKAANKITPLLEEENKSNMSAIRRSLRQRNLLLGQRPDDPIDVEADGTYNNRCGSAVGKSPMQAATQTTYLVAENMTPEKKIIAARTYSKLCKCDVQHSAGPHKYNCKANLRPDATIGNESHYLEQCIGDIQDDDLSIDCITLDGDSGARRVCGELINPRQDVDMRPLYCTRHLSRLLQVRTHKINFSTHMFSGTKDEKTQSHSLFSHDLANRVNAEFSVAHQLHGDSVSILKNRLGYLYDTVINCYMGDCSLCDEHSFVCSSEKPWYRPYINTSSRLKDKRSFIHPTSEDRTKLKVVLDLRLSPRAVDMTLKNTTQNKCEAANRGLTKAVPKHITFARNYHGRVHTAIHSMNNGPGTSLLKLCDAVGAPIPPKSPVVAALARADKQTRMNRKRKQSKSYKLQRSTKRRERYKLHDRREKGVLTYSKGAAALQDLVLKEHGYNEKSTPNEKDHPYELRRSRRRKVHKSNQ